MDDNGNNMDHKDVDVLVTRLQGTGKLDLAAELREVSTDQFYSTIRQALQTVRAKQPGRDVIVPLAESLEAIAEDLLLQYDDLDMVSNTLLDSAAEPYHAVFASVADATARVDEDYMGRFVDHFKDLVRADDEQARLNVGIGYMFVPVVAAMIYDAGSSAEVKDAMNTARANLRRIGQAQADELLGYSAKSGSDHDFRIPTEEDVSDLLAHDSPENAARRFQHDYFVLGAQPRGKPGASKDTFALTLGDGNGGRIVHRLNWDSGMGRKEIAFAYHLSSLLGTEGAHAKKHYGSLLYG